MSTDRLQRVVDSTEQDRLFRLRESVLHIETHLRFRREFLQGKGLVGTPFEDAPHFSEEGARSLALACLEFEFCRGFVVPLFDVRSECFGIEFSFDAFRALSDIDVISSMFVILEENQSFGVLVNDLFNTIVGPREFIEVSLECSLSAAREEFLTAFVHESGFNPAEKRTFTELVEFYSKLDA